MDEVTHTILEQPNNMGFGGLGSGFVGGIIGGALFGNGGFGWGNRGNVGVGYDTGAINAIQGQLNNVSGQIANADRDLLMQTANSNQFVGNLINGTGDAIVSAVTTGNQAIQGSICNLGQNVQNAIFQNTLTQVQSQGATNLGMCQGFRGVTSAINGGVNSLNMNISEQGAQSRLQAQELASQQQQCCCQILRAVEQEGCANRELQREIQYQNTRDELAQSRAREAVAVNQAFNTNLVNNAVNAIITALKPASTTA